MIGFGSYGSVCGVLSGVLLRIPILLHEQNALAGKANEFLSRFAARIAVSFPETQGKFPSQKVVYTGYPLRNSFLESSSHRANAFGEEESFKILIFGGSQGAKHLNEVCLEAIGNFDGEERKKIAVIHIIGDHDPAFFEAGYQAIGVRAKIFQFSHDIATFLRSADLVISRAGAGTIFELAAFAKPAFLIPYPHAYAHQKLNADYLTNRKAAIEIQERELTSSKLFSFISQIKKDTSLRSKMGERIHELHQPDAANQLTQLAWNLICETN